MQHAFYSFRPAVMLLLAFTVICGGIYPTIVTVLAQWLFPYQANGSMLVEQDKEVGSALIGQSFTEPKYLWGRLSATAIVPYNASASSGSNLSNANPDLLAAVQARIDALHKADPKNDRPIPVDLVTASASGLDPHISQAAAEYQLNRVAKARGLPVNVVKEVVAQYTEDRLLSILGEPVVQVLQVNLALDRLDKQSEHKQAP